MGKILKIFYEWKDVRIKETLAKLLLVVQYERRI